MSEKTTGLFMILIVFLSTLLRIADVTDLIIYLGFATILYVGVLLFAKEGE